MFSSSGAQLPLGFTSCITVKQQDLKFLSLGGHFFINNPLVLYTDRLELCIPRPVWPFLPPKITIIDCLNFL